MKRVKAPVELTSFDPLPKGFVIYKPLQMGAFDEKEIYDLEKQKRLLITRKRDGWKSLDVKCADWKLYTDGINEIDERMEHIKEELRRLRVP